MTLADLVRVRDRVAGERTASAAADTVEAIRAALDWAWKRHAHSAGLQALEYPWWRDRLTTTWSSTPREHTPTLDELARTLVLAERYKALGGTAKEIAPGIRVVGAVRHEDLAGTEAGHHVGGATAVVSLPFRELEPHRQAVGIDECVDLGR